MLNPLRDADLSYLGCDSGAVLSHETAGHAHGLCVAPSQIHVSVPYERDVAGQRGLVVHRSRTLVPANVVGSPPRTTIERTVLDLLRKQRSADAALGLVSDALRARRTTPARMRAALVNEPTAICDTGGQTWWIARALSRPNRRSFFAGRDGQGSSRSAPVVRSHLHPS
jgi:hypothetical protein